MMISHVLSLVLASFFLALPTSLASPYPAAPPNSLRLGLGPATRPLQRRADPVFPASPPSCPICAQNYGSIDSCAAAAPVLANFSQIIFNPGAFISIIECACTDTFQAAFPQCADCFEQTNQTDVLNTPDLPSVVNGLRQVCALESTLLGNVSNTDGETTPSASAAPAGSTSAAGVLAPASAVWLALAVVGLGALVLAW